MSAEDRAAKSSKQAATINMMIELPILESEDEHKGLSAYHDIIAATKQAKPKAYTTHDFDFLILIIIGPKIAQTPPAAPNAIHSLPASAAEQKAGVYTEQAWV